MFELTRSLKTHRFIALALSVAVLGILAGVVFGLPGKAGKQKQVATVPKVTSVTAGIRVVSAELTPAGSGSVLAVKLQNTTDHNIEAYTIVSGKVVMTANYFLTEGSFRAGSTIDKIIPIAADANYQLPLNGKEVTVAAVFFADGTGDGVPALVTSMADVYAGTRDQAKRILPCLQRLTLTADSLSGCVSEAVNLPVTMKGKSPDYESGLAFARDTILMNLNELQEETGRNLQQAVEKQEKITAIFKEVTENSKPN